MGMVAIALVAVLLIAFAAGLVWLVVSLGGIAVKGGPGLRSPKGFAEIAASEGWRYDERDEDLPRTLSPLLPGAFDNTAALDLLSGNVQGREVLIFKYPPAGGGKDALTVWAVRLPQTLPSFGPGAANGVTDRDYAAALSRLATSMNNAEFTSWRIEAGFLQAWSTNQNSNPRHLLRQLQPLVQAVEEIPSETWREHGR